MKFLQLALALQNYLEHNEVAHEDLMSTAILLDHVEAFRRLRYDGVPFDILQVEAEAPRCLEEFLRRPDKKRLEILWTTMPRGSHYRRTVQRLQPFGRKSVEYTPVTDLHDTRPLAPRLALPPHLQCRFEEIWRKETA